jgi:hypothetical protein
MRLAFDTFARVIRHFGEFGASGHCLIVPLFEKQNALTSKKNYLNFLDFGHFSDL